MRARGQFFVAVVLAGALAGAGVALESLGVEPRGGGPPGAAFSGAWLCPHGGGARWAVTLTAANPGPEAVGLRVRTFGSKAPSAPQEFTVEPGTEVRVPVQARTRGAASSVEYFGGWAAVGWAAEAKGDASGVAAEPCLPSAGRSWLVPDGTSEQGHDDAIVVMNPFAADAVVTVTLFFDPAGEREQPLVPKAWSELVIRGRRSVALRLNPQALGERTVGAFVEASLGRVAVASLGITKAGGIRSAIGVAGELGGSVILPGGADGGQSDVVVVGPLEEPTVLVGRILGTEGVGPATGLEDASVRSRSARSFPVITEGASAIEVTAPDAGGFAAVRRSFGSGADQGATAGAPQPRRAWIVPPPVLTHRVAPRLFLANPTEDPATVTLTLLPTSGAAEVPAPITLTVPGGSTVSAPAEFTAAVPLASVLVEASDGAIVPTVVATVREGPGYAVVGGIPLPARWTGGVAGPA